MSANGRAGTLLVVLLLVASMGSVGASGASGAAVENPLEEPIEGIDATDDADEVYVSEDGDAVLVYERPHEEAALEGEFGVETGSGLAYAHYDGEFDEDELGVSGDVTHQIDRGTTTSSGDVLVDDAAPIDELDADVEVRQTDAESVSSGDVQATVADLEPAYSSVRTDGELEITPESITSSGTMYANESDAADAPARNESLEVTGDETDDGYALEVSERRVVEEWETDRWDTREDARESLENRFSSVAIGLGGTADGSLESYHFTEDGDRNVVEYEYDVEYVGVTEQAAELAVSVVRENAETDLGETEARAMSDRLASAQLEELSISVDRHGSRTAIEWDIEADAYDELVLGTVEIAESIDAVDDDLADQFDDVRETLEVREQTELHQTATWNVSAAEDGNLTTIDATWSSDAENWRAYAAELEERDLEPLTPDRTATFSAEPADDGIDVVYDYETSDDGAIEWPLDEFSDVVTAVGGGGETGERGATDDIASVAELDDLFRTPELARVDATIEDGIYELEGAATDSDGTVDALPIGGDDGVTVSALYVETSGESSTVSVVADEFVSPEPTETDVRDREQVGSDTAVSMPGEWDREFPAIDRDRVESILDTELETGDEGGVGAGGQTSVAVALVLVSSLVAVALVGFYTAHRTAVDRA